MEVSAITTRTGSLPARFAGRSPLLRLQSDEKLVALIRRGSHGAFEALVARYQARLLSFCRHMLGSREDAEDVLQEVFAAAFNAIGADDRPITVRPWLYRIARNRCLNHLRRTPAIGVDSMDVHLADHGSTTADEVHRREEFRLLIGDVQTLAETQRSALLLREMENFSYHQIADAMETTVPAVKSLLVRARIGLAEAAEARKLTCAEVRLELGEAAEGLRKLVSPARRHLRDCPSCTAFQRHLRDTNKALAAVFPVAPLLLLKNVILAHLGGAKAAGAAGAGAAGAAGAGAAAGGAGTAAGGSALGGMVAASLGAAGTKAAAGLAAAAVVTAGAVEVRHVVHERDHARAVAAAPPPQPSPAPVPAVRPHRVPAPHRAAHARPHPTKPHARETTRARALRAPVPRKPRRVVAPAEPTPPVKATLPVKPAAPTAPPTAVAHVPPTSPPTPTGTQTVSDTATLPTADTPTQQPVPVSTAPVQPVADPPPPPPATTTPAPTPPQPPLTTAPAPPAGSPTAPPPVTPPPPSG